MIVEALQRECAAARSAWVLRYLGAPWQSGACGPHAYDCWGLVRAIYRDQLGVDLPEVDVNAHSAFACAHAFARHPERIAWAAVDTPRVFDCALLGHNDRPLHVGVWTGEALLHAVAGPGVVHQSLSSLRLHGWRVLGWYRRMR